MEFNDIIDSIAFKDELATETKVRHMNARPEPEQLDQEELHFNLPKRAELPIPPEEPEEDYDAEQNATSLVYLMSSVDTAILNGIGMLKVKAAAGGRKALSEMKDVLLKELSSVELTEDEKKLAAKFKEYKANLKLLEMEVPPSQNEIDRLIQMAIPYCENSKIKVGGGFAFWTGYAASLSQRIFKIINL